MRIKSFSTFILFCFLILSVLPFSCTSNEKGSNPDLKSENLREVKKIPMNASLKNLENVTKDFFSEIHKLSRRNIGDFRETIVILRKQPNIIKALINYYKNLEIGKYHDRKLVLSVIGELQRKDAFNFFREIIWRDIPSTPSVVDGFSLRDYEIMLQMKAVECVGYIRNENGTLYNDSQEELIKIIKDHPIKSVKITAIDTYMWNHNDNFEASKLLFKNLNSELHKYIERPRYFSGANQKVFKKRVEEWESKWGSSKQ